MEENTSSFRAHAYTFPIQNDPLKEELRREKETEAEIRRERAGLNVSSVDLNEPLTEFPRSLMSQSSRGKCLSGLLTGCHRLLYTGRLPGAWNRRFCCFVFKDCSSLMEVGKKSPFWRRAKSAFLCRLQTHHPSFHRCLLWRHLCPNCSWSFQSITRQKAFSLIFLPSRNMQLFQKKDGLRELVWGESL